MCFKSLLRSVTFIHVKRVIIKKCLYLVNGEICIQNKQRIVKINVRSTRHMLTF
jgi:hypothetical protein